MRLITTACFVFLAWFTMKFIMDNANDSQTQAYVGTLLWDIGHGTLGADATGHYTALAPYVLWPFAMAWNLISGAYEIRGLALSLVFVGACLYGLAYAWYRQLGLGWLTSLLGLVLLSTSVAFATLVRGWEIDKLIDPILFLLAALAAWRQHYAVFVVVAALGAANRETGVFMPLLALAALTQQRGSWRAALRQWPVWISAAVCLSEAVSLRNLLPPPSVRPFADFSLDRLVYVAAGVCVLPLLAVVWRSAAGVGVRNLLYMLGPIWVVFVLATDRLEQGDVLLTPLALVCVPITLAGLEQALRPAAKADAGVPEAPAARQLMPVGRDT